VKHFASRGGAFGRPRYSENIEMAGLVMELRRPSDLLSYLPLKVDVNESKHPLTDDFIALTCISHHKHTKKNHGISTDSTTA